MVSRTRFVGDTHALWWRFRSPERLSVAADFLCRLIETGKARAAVPAIVVADFHYPSAKLGRPLGASALPVTGDFEMRNSSKVDLTHRVAVASSADSLGGGTTNVSDRRY